MNSKGSQSVKDYNLEKKKIVHMLKAFDFFYKKHKKETVHDTLKNAGNPVVKKMHDILMSTIPTIDLQRHDLDGFKSGNRYRWMVQTPVELGLFFYYTDSAYRDIGDYMLYHLLMAKDELMPYLKAKHPKDFYFNIWESLKDQTHKEQVGGKIPDGVLSESEYLMVDDMQKAMVEERIIEGKKKYDKQRHW